MELARRRADAGFGSVWNHSFGSSEASEELLLGRWEAFLTPNLLAVTQGSMGRTILSAHAETPSAFEQTFLAANVWGQLPQIGGGLALRLHHRQSVALWRRAAIRTSASYQVQETWTGCVASCW